MLRTQSQWPQNAFTVFLLGALVTFFFVRGMNSESGDFASYYQAAQRILRGENIYQSSDAYPFQLAPPIALLMTPFAVLPYSFARLLFVALQGLALAAPMLIVRSKLRPAIESPARFNLALVTGILAGLRFISLELQNPQANLLSFSILSVGVGLMCVLPPHGIVGLLSFFFGSLFHLYPLMALGLLVSVGRSRYLTWSLILGLGILFFLVPSPGLWFDLPAHLEASSSAISFEQTNLTQGFFPLVQEVLGWESDVAPLVIFAFCTWLLVHLLPKFNLFDDRYWPGKRREAFVLAVGAVVLLATGISAQPGQQSFLLLWFVVPLSHLWSTKRERLLLQALCLFIGLSDPLIIGSDWALALESRQLLFVAVLFLIALLSVQARRLARGTALQAPIDATSPRH